MRSVIDPNDKRTTLYEMLGCSPDTSARTRSPIRDQKMSLREKRRMMKAQRDLADAVKRLVVDFFYYQLPEDSDR